MAYEQRELSGSLFKNDKKEAESHPDLKGSALIDGVEYWVSGWTKERQSGKWISLAFKKKDAPKKESKPAKKGRFDDMDDDIPF